MVTREGKNCQFTPIPEGLHALTLEKNTISEIFGSKMNNNASLFRDDHFHVIINDNSDTDTTGIDNLIGVGKDVDSMNSTRVNSAPSAIEG